jgi:PBP1b-binding outer membrane lipoprotein LpoB
MHSSIVGLATRRMLTGVLLTAVGVGILGCTSTHVRNEGGQNVVYEDPGTRGRVVGVGFDSQDLVGVTDRMVRDMLANPTLGAASVPPHVIVDSQYFKNESTSRINQNIITDRLRALLNQSANGRLVFVGREYAGAVTAERSLKRTGMTDDGANGRAVRMAGADYRLGGRITSIDAIQGSSGLTARHHQLVFEMFDLETGVIVWTGMYEFKKTGQDDVIYR